MLSKIKRKIRSLWLHATMGLGRSYWRQFSLPVFGQHCPRRTTWESIKFLGCPFISTFCIKPHEQIYNSIIYIFLFLNLWTKNLAFLLWLVFIYLLLFKTKKQRERKAKKRTRKTLPHKTQQHKKETLFFFSKQNKRNIKRPKGVQNQHRPKARVFHPPITWMWRPIPRWCSRTSDCGF